MSESGFADIQFTILVSFLDENIDSVIEATNFLKSCFFPSVLAVRRVERGMLFVTFRLAFHVCMDLIHEWLVEAEAVSYFMEDVI